MKKILLFVSGILFSLASMAQEDVTHYIQNAGFDEDLTWQSDGATKEIIKTETKIGRSYAWEAADSSVYAHPDGTADGKPRTDVDCLSATNGFIGRIQGWGIETNQAYPKCEWVYFGTVPYDLGPTAVPIADNGTTFLEMPAKPEQYSGADNVGALYMRAGWGARAVYKQTVNLPCAVYRLEYWAININPSATKGKNLSKVTCRDETWNDETGFTDQEWTLHTIEFTPVDEFTMEFGFESEGGSGTNPYLVIDGIKLYKTGEADLSEILSYEFNQLTTKLDELSMEAFAAGFAGLAAQIGDYALEIDGLIDYDNLEATEANLKVAKAQYAKFQAAIAKTAGVNAQLTKMENLVQSTDYPGKAAFEEAYQKILKYKDGTMDAGTDYATLIEGAEAEAAEAIRAYYMSQTGSEENPADFTFFIKNPWFITTAAEPIFSDGTWVFPLQFDEEGNERYVEGSASSPDLTSEGWYIAGSTGGDQRLNWQRGRSCWNAWRENFTDNIAIAQDIEGLPNGYYTVSCDLITQTGFLTNQHAFAKSVAEKKESNSLTIEGWDNYEWETVSMAADQKVLVLDGKLTIGAEGTGTGSGASGWFCATNFHLYYLGEASNEAAQVAYEQKVASANEMLNNIQLAADRAALSDAIAANSGSTDYIAAMTSLQQAMDEAQKSIDKYESYIPSSGEYEGKTIPTVQMTLLRNGGEGYGAAEEIVEFAYDWVMDWIGSAAATYTDFDATVNSLKNYLNTYTPVYNDAASMAEASSAAGKAALDEVMSGQKSILTSEMQSLETVNQLIAELKTVLNAVKKQNAYDDPQNTDYTAFIINPNLEAEDGWTFNKGTGGSNTNGGQWFDGSSTRYIDSYNQDGLSGYIATQLISDLPNGTYTVGAYTRTPAEGAYIFTAIDADTTYVEIPMNYYNTFTELGEDTVVVASDQYGPIWEEAEAAVNSGDYTDLQYATYNANSGKGRGWQHQEMTGIEVKNHQLTIGTKTGVEGINEKTFTGNWYSVGGWTLTLTAAGDNTGWAGPMATGISSINTATTTPNAIYNLSGLRQQKLQRGLNIVVRNGKVQKVLVK